MKQAALPFEWQQVDDLLDQGDIRQAAMRAEEIYTDNYTTGTDRALFAPGSVPNWENQGVYGDINLTAHIIRSAISCRKVSDKARRYMQTLPIQL